jgi:hypothetical protein
MTFIDRYVYDVGRRLPRKERDDVEAELKSNLHDTLDDRTKGQPTDEDEVALLKEFGPPEKVAASYRPASQYLIGPDLYPIFRTVAAIVVFAVTIGLLASFVVGLIFNQGEMIDIGRRLLDALSNYFQAVLMGLGSVDPNDLPEVVQDYNRMGRAESAVGLAANLVFFILLNLFADRIGLVYIVGEEPLLNNIVQDNLFWLNAILLAGVLLHAILFLQGRWHFYTRLFRLAIDVTWLFVIYNLVTALSAEKETLIAAGLTEPLPTMAVGIGYFILIASGISIVVNTVKWLWNALQQPKLVYKLPE